MKIKDLPENNSLTGVRFFDPKTLTVGYWYSQWGYSPGKAGVWYKTDMASGSVFPLFLDDLREALEFEVVGKDFKPPKKPSRKDIKAEREKYQAIMEDVAG